MSKKRKKSIAASSPRSAPPPQPSAPITERSKINELHATVEILQALWGLQNEASKADTQIVDEGITPRGGVEASKNPARRQTSDEDDPLFVPFYGTGQLLEPYWKPYTLYKLFEESDKLERCLRIRTNNIVRPYDFIYCGPREEKDSPQTKAELRKLQSFFSQVNEKHSWLTVAGKGVLDGEITGGEFYEVLPANDTHEPDLMYHAPATYMRVTPLDQNDTLIWVMLPRNGQLRKTAVYRKFRRFCRAMPTKELVWFKEFGDPRIVDRRTGQYAKDKAGNYLHEPEDYPNKATEIWWFRPNAFGGNIYGIPPWVSVIAEIRGRYLASWVNYDTLDHGGLPPWLLLIYGRVSEGTQKYLKELAAKWRDPNAYSDPGVLMIEPNLLSFSTQGGSKAGAEFVSMRDMRNEEAMFPEYRRDAAETIGAVLGVPAILQGITEGAGGPNYAALEAAEQGFKAERRARDERINVELIQGRFKIFNWKYKSKDGQITMDALPKALMAAARVGGPSLNDLTQLQNELFGTNWPIREHWFYKDISAAEATGMVRQGMVIYDSETHEPKIIAPQGSIDVGGGGLEDLLGSAAKSDASGEEEQSNIITELQPLANLINLSDAMKKIERKVRNYQPKQIEEKDLAM